MQKMVKKGLQEKVSFFLTSYDSSQQRRRKSYEAGEVDLKNVKYLHHYSTLPSRISFYWLTPLLWLGYKQPLEEEDLGELPPEESTNRQFQRFYEHYEAEQVRM